MTLCRRYPTVAGEVFRVRSGPTATSSELAAHWNMLAITSLGSSPCSAQSIE